MPATANAATESSIPDIARSSARRSSVSHARPAASCPPPIRMQGSPRSASTIRALDAAASSNPMSTRHTRPPCPSTSALVASVVESETSAMAAGSTPEPSSTDLAAPRIPTARSCRVVSAFAAATTRPDCSSYSTASVYVPPVSIPSRMGMVAAKRSGGNSASSRNCVGIGGIASRRRDAATRSYVRRPAETGISDRETAGNHDPRYALRLDGRLQARRSGRR